MAKRRPPEPVDCQVAVLMCEDHTAFQPEFACASLTLPCDTEEMAQYMLIDRDPKSVICLAVIMNGGRLRTWNLYCTDPAKDVKTWLHPLAFTRAVASTILAFRVGLTDVRIIIDPDGMARSEGF